MNPVLNLPQILLGTVLALTVVIGAYAARALTISGAIAAFVLGTLIFGLGGLPWAALLLTFFITSSLLSLVLKQRQRSDSAEVEKGSKRDAWQVLANGGIAGLMVVLGWFSPASALPWLAGAAALAAANADTWATELGSLSKKLPVLITSGKRVPRGTSGGVSVEGFLASAAGAALVATVFFVLTPHLYTYFTVQQRWGWTIAVGFGGLAGSLVDSLLGATLQAVFFCPACGKETEKHPLHHCGIQTNRVRGWQWLNNDWVNLFCTLSGGILAFLISLFL